MLKVIINFLVYTSLATALLNRAVSASSIGDVYAEALWIDAQNTSQKVMFAQRIGEEWQDESSIYESDNAMTSLALGTSPFGDKLMIWTEQKRLKTALMFMTASTLNGQLQWSQASTFSNKGHENFSASIIYDTAGTAWVFWASTRDDFSDIVLRKFDGSWRDIEQVHAPNSVPDIKPNSSVSEAGLVQVEWKSYDYQVGDYVKRSRQFSSGAASEDRTVILVDKVLPDDVQLPPNRYTGALTLLHFPSNQMIQSVQINQGSVSE